jgi:hypothetical protein
MVEVTLEHFKQAALEIGKNSDNDTLPYDIDSNFISGELINLSSICLELFNPY